jgi:hypothetical protein
MTAQRLTLLQARKTYSKCAALLDLRIRAAGYTQGLSDQIIGIGIAADWLRRAAEMEDIQYLGTHLNRSSSRKAGFVELVRYGFSWFALNAVFTRPVLLQKIGTPAAKGEYEDFLVLFNSAGIGSVPTRLRDLHALLRAPTSPRLPGLPSGTAVPTLSAIHAKYLPRNSHGKTAKAVTAAATSGNIVALDLPTLLYAFRNWSVHGNALDGSFGSRPGFLRYAEILQETLAEIHLATAISLQKSL